ncbi:MAG: DUF2064 domain-containing protein [Taibaiella sp.]|nr:DUF2064 domain-containing protein [Taibaiella sp.]
MPGTAILIFTRSAMVENNFKHFANHAPSNIELLARLNEKVISLAENSGLPYFIYDELCQEGNTFGERLSNAVNSVLQYDFENVIVLGNDCPQLDKKHLKNAIALLQTNRLVIGPDTRGGAYLIGINRSIFNSDAFQALPWQSQNLFSALCSYECAAILSRLHDINDCKDINQVVASLSLTSAIRNFLIYIISCGRLFYSLLRELHVSSFIFSDRPLRAPPVSF